MRKVSSIKIYVICLLLAFTAMSCKNPKFTVNSGDLLFQINERNDFTDAITSTTGNRTSFSFSHVGIVIVEADKLLVAEASPDKGVRKVALDSFLNSSAHNVDGKPLVIAYRLKTKDVDLNKILVNVNSFIGLSYDSVFLPENNAMYCSELVYESFFDKAGNHILTQNPMSFSDSTGNISPLWIEYFRKMDCPVPEGVLGTNPNDLSKDKALKELRRWF